MSTDRIEVTLGPDGGTKVFKTFVQVAEWLGKERTFWNIFQSEPGQTHEGQVIWQPFDNCFRNITEILSQVQTAEREAAECEQRAAQPNISPQQREQLMQRVNFDYSQFRERLKGTFAQHYQANGLIPSSSPRAKFLATLAKERSPRTALFACGYLMGANINFGSPDRLEGALAASYFEQGFTSRNPSEVEALTELRHSWQKQFQDIHDSLSSEARRQSELNIETGAQQLKQQSEFADLVRKEQSDWATLHKTYDESLALAKPVEYWRKKARSHLWLSWAFGIVALLAGGGVFWLLNNLIHETLRVPDGVKDPVAWHPGYWRLAVMIAAGVFGVWVIRILVRLFLSHVHLLSDANERVTMALTYLSLLRSDGGLPEKDRQLILQTLFRPASSGVVKDDGVPLSWIEAITRTGSK